MKIVVCAKQVLDPDGVNNYAQWGRLKIDPEVKVIARDGITLLMNAYDEQGIEAALRLRDAGADCTITVLTVGDEGARDILKHAFALGADQCVLISDSALGGADGSSTAYALAKAIEKLGGADLVLCGRQASDDDQGVVGPGLAELLGIPSVTLAKDVRLAQPDRLRVARVNPEGEETVEVSLPALVTITSELGTPRYPTMRQLMDARRKAPTVWTAQDIGADPGRIGAAGAHIRRLDLFVPEVQGNCEYIEGATVEEKVTRLLDVLTKEKLIQV